MLKRPPTARQKRLRRMGKKNLKDLLNQIDVKYRVEVLTKIEALTKEKYDGTQIPRLKILLAYYVELSKRGIPTPYLPGRIINPFGPNIEAPKIIC